MNEQGIIRRKMKLKFPDSSRRIIMLHCNSKCIIKDGTACAFGLSPSHLFKSNTMIGNKYWNYSKPDNAVVMCGLHHDRYEKLNPEDRIEYIRAYCIVLTDAIVRRMINLYAGKRPRRIYPSC